MVLLKYRWTPEQAGLINIDDSKEENEASDGSSFIKNNLIPAWVDSREVAHVYKTDYAEGFKKNSGDELSLQDTRPAATEKLHSSVSQTRTERLSIKIGDNKLVMKDLETIGICYQCD